MAGPLLIEGALTLEHAGAQALRIGGAGAIVRADIAGRAAALSIARQAGVLSRARRRSLGRATSLLVRAGLTVEVRVGRRLVARAGAGVRPGLVSRLAGLPDAEVRLLPALAALLLG